MSRGDHEPRAVSGVRRRVLVGSRASGLALRQTEEVLGLLRTLNPDADFEVSTLRTSGDAAPEAPLVSLGPGIFVKDIERALLSGEVAMAVHSLKDMPTVIPDGLIIGAVCQRLDPRDVLVNRWGCSLDELPPGARIGTSSPRRVAQLKALRRDVEALPIRGNVDTRLRKSRGADYDGVILAAAGLIRMNLEAEVAEFLSPSDFVPAPGQGALAVELREDDEETIAMLSAIDHYPTRRAVTAERAFLKVLGGGCQVPVGAYARSETDMMALMVFLASPDGSKVFKAKAVGGVNNPKELAIDAYQRLIERGAGGLMGERHGRGAPDLD